MKLTLNGQKPTTLEPVHAVSLTGAIDPMAILGSLVVDPLLGSSLPGQQVSITDDAGDPVGRDDVLALFARCLGDTRDSQAETAVLGLLDQSLVHFRHNDHVTTDMLYLVQHSQRHHWPLPEPMVVYTAGADVTPAAKRLLAGTDPDCSQLSCAIGFAHHPQTLGLCFTQASDFEDFKSWFCAQAGMIPGLDPSVQSKVNQFAQIQLDDLLEGLILREKPGDHVQDGSFARLLHTMAMRYASVAGSDRYGIMPFSVGQLIHPEAIVLVNAERHARSSEQAVRAAWSMVNSTLSSPVRMVSTSSLSKMSTIARNARRIQGAAAMAASGPGTQLGRSAKVVFSGTKPSPRKLVSDITKVLLLMGKVNQSQNVLMRRRRTFAKANRRRPDDPNRTGRTTTKDYLPDLHIYLDCSGSISESDYKEAVLMLIQLAVKLDINIYFNSFSHVLSQEVMLPVKGRTVDQVWKAFSAIPKVAGGTDYKQIWRYVEMSPERKSRLNLIMTDFEWHPPRQVVPHHKSIYYAAIAPSTWSRLVTSAQQFMRDMKHIQPRVSSKLLGVYA